MTTGRLRILHVVEANDGGVLALLRVYAEAQSARGHDVHLLAPVDRDVRSAAWRQWAVDRHRPHGFVAAALAVRKAVQQHRPDVVHLHSFFAGLLGRAALRATPPGPAVVYQPHSWAYDAVGNRVARSTIIGIERLADRRTHHLIANCAEELAEGHAHGVRSDGVAVGMPIPVADFTPPDPQTRARLRAELTAHDRLVVCVGRLTRQKGQDRLVAAWERSPLPGAELVLIGGGELETLRDLAPVEWGRSIRSVGHQGDVRPWLQAADLMALPSRYEGQSVAVAEALACGLPVVMCDVNGAHDAVTRGPQPPAGAVVAQGDMAMLLRECRRRLDDDGLLESERRAARTRATVLFDVLAVADRVELAYERALQARAATPTADGRRTR